MNIQEKMFPYVEIIEQPAKKGHRFSYEYNKRATKFISGENSKPDKKTYPTIRIVGYEGQAVVVISCVTSNETYRPHPHHVIGREHNNQGIFTFNFYNDQNPISFPELRILCTKKKDVVESLQLREKIQVDPFKTGFDFNINEIDLNAVRLCFQVFLQEQNGKFEIALEPIVSNPIYDKKDTIGDLVICSLSHFSAPTSGGMEMILLCNKIDQKDIQIVFYEQVKDQVIWQDFGEFQPADVHKQLAISFKTPKYSLEVTDPVQVKIMLQKPSNGTTSEPWPFTLIPTEENDTEISPSPSTTNLNFDINSAHDLEELTLKDLEDLTNMFTTSFLLTEESAEIKEDTDGNVSIQPNLENKNNNNNNFNQ